MDSLPKIFQFTRKIGCSYCETSYLGFLEGKLSWQKFLCDDEGVLVNVTFIGWLFFRGLIEGSVITEVLSS